MIIALASTQSLTVTLDAAPATNQLACSASWADQNGALGGQDEATIGVTAVTVVPAPASSVNRAVNSLTVINLDTAIRIVTVSRVTSGTPNKILKVSLGIGYTLTLAADGWAVTDANGVFQSSGSGGGGAGVWGSITGTLVSQADLVAALLVSQSQVVGINPQTSTAYTPILSDAGKDVQCTNSSAIAFTVPTNASVAYPIGTMIAVSQGGAGIVTITAVTPGTTTIVAATGAATTASGDARVIEKIATDIWRVW